MIEIGRLTRLDLGYEGENRARVIEIDVSEWLNKWPGAHIGILVQRPGEEEYYPAAAAPDGDLVRWTVTRADTEIPGQGLAQIKLLTDDDEELRSKVVRTEIRESLPGTMMDEPEAPAEEIVNETIRAASRAQAAADVASEQADAAGEHALAAAQSAEAAAAAANAAAASAEDAEAAADAAEGFSDAAVEAGEIAVEAAERAEKAAQDAMNTMPAIEQVAEDEVVTITDAAQRDALEMITTIRPVFSGTGEPSPSNIMPMSPRTNVSLWREDTYDTSAQALASETIPETYGGVIDWLTGQLTITHKFVTLDGSVNWQLGTNNIFVRCNDIAQGATLYSNQYVDAPTQPVANMAENQMRQGATYQNVVFANPKNALTKAQWAERANSQPIQLAYTLEQPTVVQLTARTVEMLKGANAIWSDAGATKVGYVVETKAYIDKLIGDIYAYLDEIMGV